MQIEYRQYTPKEIQTIWENDGFHDWCDYHMPGTTPEHVYESVRDGMLSIHDLDDFDWGEYLDE